jgi:CDP-diacylglycerol--serine O-phosphatidyltransferase
MTVLLPIYLYFLGVSNGLVTAWITFFYTLAIGLLMVSRLPVFSGKRVGKRVPPEMVLPVFVVVVLFFALLISYPWEVLSVGAIAYLVLLPLGALSYRNYQRKDAEEAKSAVAPGEVAATSAAGELPPPGTEAGHQDAGLGDDRPARLN